MDDSDRDGADRDRGFQGARPRKDHPALRAQRQFLPTLDTRRRARRSPDPWRGDLVAGERLNSGFSRLWLRIFHDADLESGHREVRRRGGDFRNPRHLRDRDGDRRAGRRRHRHFSHRAVSASLAPADRRRHRAAGGNPKHNLRNLGPVRVRAVSAATRPARPHRPLRQRSGHVVAVRGASLRHRHADRVADPGDHGAAVRLLDFARRVRNRAADAEGIGLWHRLHDLGGRPIYRDPVHAGRRHRRRHARSRTRARRNHGGNLRDRQRPQNRPVAARAGNDDFRDHRQRVHRGGRRSLHLVADRARPDPVHDHVRRSCNRAASC